MRGDIWRCPTCGNTLVEADCVYTEAACTRTLACRRGIGRQKGATPMRLERAPTWEEPRPSKGRGSKNVHQFSPSNTHSATQYV